MLHLEIGSCYQLTQDVHSKLQALGILSAVQFIVHDLEELAVKSRVSFRDLLAVRRYLLAKHACVPINGSQLYESVLASTAILSTGNERLNDLLDGGLYTGEITELSGPTAVGKTQVKRLRCGSYY